MDRNGEIVGRRRVYDGIDRNVDPGRYVERPGLDERVSLAGADVRAVRRMLGVSR